MFTAEDARWLYASDFDKKIEQIVKNAHPRMTAQYNVYWREDGGMSERIDEAERMLKERGFTILEIRDRDSFRFAEIHFTWEEQ